MKMQFLFLLIPFSQNETMDEEEESNFLLLLLNHHLIKPTLFIFPMAHYDFFFFLSQNEDPRMCHNHLSKQVIVNAG